VYSLILSLHNITRWIVLILGIMAAFRSFVGLSAQKEWTSLDHRWGMLFTLTMDIQFLLGLALYFYLSPITRQVLSHFGSAFQNSDQRFFALIHVLYMLLAIVFTHLGSILPRKTDNPLVKHQRAATFFSLAVFSILLGIPWTRPLFPGF
jgi:hypothetical protein